MNTHTSDGEPTRYLLLKNMLEYLDENEPTDEWKAQHVEFVKDAAETFLDPTLIAPWIQDRTFRTVAKEASILAGYLHSQIKKTNTFDSEVFRIIGRKFMYMCDVNTEDDDLLSSFEKMNFQ